MRIDLDGLKELSEQISFEKQSFNKIAYNSFSNSYLNGCSEPTIARLIERINEVYKKIQNGYTQIDNWTKSYVDAVEQVEKELIEKYNLEIANYSNQLNDLEQLETENDATLLEKIGSTISVWGNAIVFGVADVVESIADGLYWVGASCASAVNSRFDEELSQEILDKMIEDIKVEVVETLKVEFYENTELGTKINENSYTKYDSETAEFIQNTTKMLGEVALYTGATLATGGTAGVVLAGGIGGVKGIGEKAEELYIEGIEYKESIAPIVVTGVVSGLESAAMGKGGSDAVDGIAKIAKSYKLYSKDGIKFMWKSNLKTILKTNGMNIVKESGKEMITSPDAFLSAVAVVVDDVYSAIEDSNNSNGKTTFIDEFSLGNIIKEVGTIYTIELAGNFLGEVGSELIEIKPLNNGKGLISVRSEFELRHPDVDFSQLSNEEIIKLYPEEWKKISNELGIDTVKLNIDKTEINEELEKIDDLDNKFKSKASKSSKIVDYNSDNINEFFKEKQNFAEFIYDEKNGRGTFRSLSYDEQLEFSNNLHDETSEDFSEIHDTFHKIAKEFLAASWGDLFDKKDLFSDIISWEGE